MATRGTGGKLQDLADEVSRLEKLANNVQVDDDMAGAAAAEDLGTAYRHWFSACLQVLPEDLRERFRNEYEGGTFTARIKHFLQDPRKKSVIYREDMDEVSKRIWSPWQYAVKDQFLNPLRQQHQFLEEALARLGRSTVTTDALQLLERVARGLPNTFAILSAGHRGRSGLHVSDEYDVQHILHAVSVLHFEEVEPEEQTPKMAGASSRLDFLLKQERVAIETKMTRDGLSRSKLREELASDILYFRAHPHVEALFIFVFDPKRKIMNESGFEHDLRSDSDDFLVRVVVAR
jgi:hypothetical protein